MNWVRCVPNWDNKDRVHTLLIQVLDIQFKTKLKRAVSELESNVDRTPFPILFSLIGWSHHVEIIKKTKDVEAAP